jgi:uncharacterized MAPEG superfamily protein
MLLSHWALLGFVVWTLLLVIAGIGLPRLSAITLRKAPVTGFSADVPHGDERYRRTMRAHANCVENLPVFATLVILGSLLAVPDALFQTAAFIVLPARILQSVSHVASGKPAGVLARFWFFTIQLVCFAVMIFLLVQRGMASSPPG